MGCSSSAGRGTNAQHDVCVTCASPVLAPEDFAPFFGDWIMKACAEMKLSCISSRPQLGPELPKAGSRLERQLRAAILNSKVAVCILNMTKGCEMPPPGIKAEVTWASQRNIPVVPFYDADRYDWKEAATWKVEIPICFRWGLGPVRYKRQAHEEAKEQLRAALRAAMKDLEFRGSTQEQEQKEQQRLQQVAQSLGGGAEGGGEFSRAELRLREARHSSSASQEAAARRAALVAEEADLEDVALGLDRSDFERARLVPQRLERTNSMRDINLDSALAILARGAAQTRDPLAAREGGCQLQLISEDVNQELLQGGDPKHRILAPVKGILRKAKGVAAGGAGGLPSGTVKQLRLSPEALEQRRFRFSVQLLQNHLDQLQTDDVHELITVLKCLQGGEQPLVLRSLRLLKAFLEAHVVLHDRALQQGLIESVVDVMRQQAEVDVLTLGVACLSAVLRGAAQRGMLGPEALNFCGRSEVPPLAQEDLVTSISKSGGVPAILDGMRRFPACEGLVEKGCLCVVLLTSGTEDNKVSADYAQGQHQESSVLLRSQSRRLVARLGGVELLMKAMQRFTRNEPLQRSCCAALGQLANEVKEVDVEQKVVQLLMQALRAPPRAAGGTEASSCARYGAQALRHFATHGETKSFIARLGGIEELHDLALRGLQAPSTNQQLRAAATEALGALCHLASKHPENKLRIFEAGCLELAFQALGSSTTAPAETAEGVEASEATEVPEPELAMAACGLLHNMSVDAAIRSHVVKLGGRAAAERLAASHPEGAVRNLAMLLSKTLKPREEAAGDPFGALFAQRTPGLAAPRRVASKRERKIASEVKAAYAQAEEPR